MVDPTSTPPAPAPTPTTTPTRRQQIIEVAAGLFAERGFHGVSIYDLGAAMGTSGAALYKHFASKDALLGAMLVGISEELLAVGTERAAAARDAGPEAVLKALIAWHVEFAVSKPALITVQFRDLENLAPEDRHTVRALQRRYVELWVDAIKATLGTDEATARSAAHIVFGLINSTPHTARARGTDLPDLLRRMALAAVRAAAS
jgi:AcrR family transcriptional regulator